MRVAAAPGLPSKLEALSESQRAQFGRLLSDIDDGEGKEQVLERLGSRVSRSVDEGVYTVRVDSSGRLVLSFGTDDDGEYAILLDVIFFEEKKHKAAQYSMPRARDPRVNNSLNPQVNRSLDPRVNRRLDPDVNRSLDPNVNRSLDPRVNRSLDPTVNRSLDPNVNRSLDPRINRSLDPKINRTLDPRINRTYGGPYLYDRDLNNVGFLVRARSSVFLVFDGSASYQGYIHPAQDDVLLRFNRSGEWEEYWIEATNEVWLRYGIEGKWNGIVVMD